MNFNPRSRVGNDVNVVVTLAKIMISIHVPAWGTTYCTGADSFTCRFQSTFPRGERHSWVLVVLQTARFQSTFPRGERRDVFRLEAVLFVISIHVPAWGTTSLSDTCPFSSHDFNPRSRVGNDCKFSQIFFAFLCNKYNFSTFYYPFSLFFGVIHFTFLIFAVRILPIFYVYF